MNAALFSGDVSETDERRELGNLPEMRGNAPRDPFLQTDEPFRDRVFRKLGSRMETQLFRNAEFMEFDCFYRDVQERGDLFHPLSFGDELEHFALARCQTRRRPPTGMPRRRVQGRVQDILGNQRGHIVLAFHDCMDGFLELHGRGALDQVA